MIDRSDHEWGVRLTVKPFQTAKYFDLFIQADLHKPTSTQRKKVLVTFRGTAAEPLRYTDARTWHAAYSALLAEVDKVAEEIAPKKRAASKAAKKKS